MKAETSQKAHRSMMGTVASAVVSDGTNAYHNPMRFLFQNAPTADLDRVLRARDIDPDAWTEWVTSFSSTAV